MLSETVDNCAGLLESWTLAVNPNVPAALGVPLIIPPLLRLIPGGSAPALTLQTCGARPPADVNVTGL